MEKPIPVNPGVKARAEARQSEFQAPPTVVPPPRPPMIGEPAGGTYVPPPSPPVPYLAPDPAGYGSQGQAVPLPVGFWWVWSAGSVLPFLGSLILLVSGNINLFTLVLLLVGSANLVSALLTEGYAGEGEGDSCRPDFCADHRLARRDWVWAALLRWGCVCPVILSAIALRSVVSKEELHEKNPVSGCRVTGLRAHYLL